MASIAALVRWDGRPEAECLATMLAAGPFPACASVLPADVLAALAHAGASTLPGPLAGQPIADPGRRLWLAFDGRLDNRPDLLDQLGPLDPQVPDAALALAAFARWGEGAGARLLGDFAFVAWDGAARRLVCCRDHLGIRPLYYHASPARFVCASEIAQVLAHPAVPREPDLATVADHLACDVRNGGGTLYRHVSRVPPGHAVIAEPGRIRIERYWAPEPRSPIRYRDDEAYAAHCRELLGRSVAARLRSASPVAAMLSGGLDSSSVVCVAHRIAAPGAAPRAFSMIYPDHPESDERAWIGAVLRHCGAAGIQVRPDRICGASLARRASAWAAPPPMPADETAGALYGAMREAGCGVTLTGAGGDFLFTGSVFQYADLLRERRPVAAVRRFVDDWYAGDTGRSMLGLLQAGVWPLLSDRVRGALRPAARRVIRAGAPPAWLRLAPSPPVEHPAVPRGGSFATEDVVRQIGSGMHGFFIESADRTAAAQQVELRHPLLDVRLVQFALDIPDTQRKRGRFTKFVLREALGGDLPPSVRGRRTKGDFTHVVAEALEAVGGERFFGALAIADAGWVDGAALAARYRGMRSRAAGGPEAYGDDVPVLWMTAAVELWYRGAFGGGSALPRG